jgi:tetratricopeptide (TPR) repeat protein
MTNKFLKNKFTGILLVLMVISISGYAQRSGKAFRIGKEAFESKEYIRAIGWLSIAIESQKSKYNEAYVYRAQSYDALNRKGEAIKDYIASTKLFPDRADLKLKTARLLYNQENYNEALQYATSTLDVDTANFEALKLQSLALTHMGNAESGLMISDKAAEIQEDAEVLFAKALASDSLGLNDYAIAYYNEAIASNKSFKPPYHDMGRLLVRNGYYQKAIDIFSQAAREFNDPVSYRLRSLVYGATGNTLAQISDLTKILTLEPTRIDLYFERAEQYKRINLLQNALSDITYYLEWDPYSSSAWFLKGSLLEELYMFPEAIVAFENVLKYSEDKSQIETAKKTVFRLKKEKYPPKISIISPPGPDEATISLGKDETVVLIKGNVEDVSKIDRIFVNGKIPDTIRTAKGISFSIHLTVDTIKNVTVLASDVYQNTTNRNYKIIRVEKEPPVLFLQQPLLNADSMVLVQDQQLVIKGFFYEESGLKWVRINGKRVQTQFSDSKYYFNDKLDVFNNDSLIIEASDFFSNEITYQFKLLRADSLESNTSPLGKTWYVLVVSDSISSVLPELREYKNQLVERLDFFKLDSLLVINAPTKEEIERLLLFSIPENTMANRIETVIFHMVGPGVIKGDFTYWVTRSSRKNLKYDLLNTSIIRSFFEANKSANYKTFISESVVVGDNVFEKQDDCNCTECNNIQSIPDKGQFILNINVGSWHNYKSQYLQSLTDVVKSKGRCFSAAGLINHDHLNFGTLKGNNRPLFPAVIYLKSNH